MMKFTLLLTTAFLSLSSLSYAMEERDRQEPQGGPSKITPAQLLEAFEAARNALQNEADLDQTAREQDADQLLQELKTRPPVVTASSFNGARLNHSARTHEFTPSVFSHDGALCFVSVRDSRTALSNDDARASRSGHERMIGGNPMTTDSSDDDEDPEYLINKEAQDIVSGIPNAEDFADSKFLKNKSEDVCNRVLALLINDGELTYEPHLSFDGTQVSDLTLFAELTGLETLSLEGTQVSDLTPLEGLENLKALWLSGTPVSRDQVIKLSKKLPNCTIYSNFGDYKEGSLF